MAKIKLSKIQIDGGTQPREDIDEDLVSEYANAMQEGDPFPSVVIFNDGVKYWLADGFHRYHASNKVGYLEIDAEVKQGTKRDAILYSVSANSTHGKRRTNADKRKAVLTLLEDKEWSGWSDLEIARQCQVSQPTVSKYRKEVEASYKDYKIERKVKRGDQEYTVDTSNIGKKPGNSEDEDTDWDEEFEDEWEEEIEEPTNEVERVRPERKGIGLDKAHEAIAILKQIPPNDDLLQEGYDIVIQWINYNR